MQQIKQIFRFGLVGGTGFLVDALILQTLLSSGLGEPFTARIISIGIAALVTWRLNRAFTFKSEDDNQVAEGQTAKGQAAEGARYGSIVAISSAINYLIYATLLLVFPNLTPLWALATASVGAMFLSYLGFSRFVFLGTKAAIQQNRLSGEVAK